MKTTIIAITAAAGLAASSAWAGTITCQRIGDATACSDGTIVQPLGSGAYVTRTPRDSWGQQRHDMAKNAGVRLELNERKSHHRRTVRNEEEPGA
jgi:hypothetical protein